MNTKTKVSSVVGGSICCVATLILIILLSMTWKRLEADEIGVAYDSLTMQLSLNSNGKAYTEGRHPIGPSSSFFIFKRTVQTLDYEADPIKCLSSEGLQMTLKITLQYEIDPDHVMDILTQYGEEESWRVYINSVTRDALKDVCGNYTADDYFHHRAEIEKNLFDTSNKYFNESKTYSRAVVLNLRNVQHPGGFVNANQEKQQIEQEKDRLVREREDLITKETTVLLTAQENAKIKQINANATARAAVEKALSLVPATLAKAEAYGPAIIQKANELAPAEARKWEKRGDALVNIWSQMEGVSLDEFLDTYVRYSILTQQGNKKILSLSTKDVDVNLISLLDPIHFPSGGK